MTRIEAPATKCTIGVGRFPLRLRHVVGDHYAPQ
jgi:hypothetical protein